MTSYFGETKLIRDSQHFAACVNKFLAKQRTRHEKGDFALYDTVYEKLLNHIREERLKNQINSVEDTFIKDFLLVAKRVLIYSFEFHKEFF